MTSFGEQSPTSCMIQWFTTDALSFIYSSFLTLVCLVSVILPWFRGCFRKESLLVRWRHSASRSSSVSWPSLVFLFSYSSCLTLVCLPSITSSVVSHSCTFVKNSSFDDVMQRAGPRQDLRIHFAVLNMIFLLIPLLISYPSLYCFNYFSTVSRVLSKRIPRSMTSCSQQNFQSSRWFSLVALNMDFHFHSLFISYPSPSCFIHSS